MKRIVAVALALALAGYFVCGAYAADQAAPAAGSKSVQASSSDNANDMGSGMVKAGSQRIAVSGGANYATTSGNTNTYNADFNVDGEYSYMILDQFELALRTWFDLSQSGVSGSQTRTQSYAAQLVPKWRIPVEGNISPYIGPMAGLAYVTSKGSGTLGASSSSTTFHDAEFMWGAVAGADIFLSKHTSLFVELDYTQYKSGGHDLGGGSIRVQDVGLAAGLAYWW